MLFIQETWEEPSPSFCACPRLRQRPVSVKRMLKGFERSLRSPRRRQICLGEFDSLPNVAILCPLFRGYLDERLWKPCNSNSGSATAQNLNSGQFWKEINVDDTKLAKSTVMIGYLKAILRNALRLEPEDPEGDDANLQELGVDSWVGGICPQYIPPRSCPPH